MARPQLQIDKYQLTHRNEWKPTIKVCIRLKYGLWIVSSVSTNQTSCHTFDTFLIYVYFLPQ